MKVKEVSDAACQIMRLETRKAKLSGPSPTPRRGAVTSLYGESAAKKIEKALAIKGDLAKKLRNPYDTGAKKKALLKTDPAGR